MQCKATRDRWVMVESSDKMWSTGEGMANQYSCLENPMNSMKRQKDRTLKDELPRSVGTQCATGYQWRRTPERMKFSSVTQSCPTLYDPMNRSMSSLPVHHQLPEFTQTHTHRIRVAIWASHSLSSPSTPSPNPFQHQSLFQ